MDDMKAIAGIVTAAGTSAGAGAISVATITSSAPGFLGLSVLLQLPQLPCQLQEL